MGLGSHAGGFGSCRSGASNGQGSLGSIPQSTLQKPNPGLLRHTGHICYYEPDPELGTKGDMVTAAKMLPSPHRAYSLWGLRGNGQVTAVSFLLTELEVTDRQGILLCGSDSQAGP